MGLACGGGTDMNLVVTAGGIGYSGTCNVWTYMCVLGDSSALRALEQEEAADLGDHSACAIYRQRKSSLLSSSRAGNTDALCRPLVDERLGRSARATDSTRWHPLGIAASMRPCTDTPMPA